MARSAAKRGHELGSRKPRWTYPSDRWVRDCQRLVELDNRLPEFLSGESQPADAAERLAQLCYDKQLYKAAARFYDVALGAEPEKANDLGSATRYNAACAAALAGVGQGRDDPALDEAARARWRAQAQDWLRATLAAWAKLSEGGTPQAQGEAERRVRRWRTDPDLAGVRDEDGLAKLPESERESWHALWAEVDQLLQDLAFPADPFAP